jgi:SAM-dependent methyltransferase
MFQSTLRKDENPEFIENLQEFYSTILEYYDELFPLKDEAVQFFVRLQNEMQAATIVQPSPLCRFLSIGCATGNLENRLAGYGMDVTGIDKNPDMIETAKRRMKRLYSTLRFFEMPAIDMSRFLKQGSFNLISCIENTIPYISDETLLRKFFHDARSLLAPGGKFVVQTLNFDAIDLNQAFRLPDLGSVRVTLRRSYIPKENGQMLLEASLELGNGKTIILQKTTSLISARTSTLEEYASEAGFRTCFLYGNFDFSPWTRESPKTILVFC